MTSREIADATNTESNYISSRLESYRLYNYIFKRKRDKKPNIWGLTKEGKIKLERLDLKFAPNKIAIINLAEPPYNSFDKVIIKNGNEEKSVIELKTKV